MSKKKLSEFAKKIKISYVGVEGVNRECLELSGWEEDRYRVLMAGDWLRVVHNVRGARVYGVEIERMVNGVKVVENSRIVVDNVEQLGEVAQVFSSEYKKAGNSWDGSCKVISPSYTRVTGGISSVEVRLRKLCGRYRVMLEERGLRGDVLDLVERKVMMGGE